MNKEEKKFYPMADQFPITPIKELDLTKYEGHTPGPWDINYYDEWYVFSTADTSAILNNNQVDVELMADAPDLLAEVKRLREKIIGLQAKNDRLTESNNIFKECAKINREIMSSIADDRDALRKILAKAEESIKSLISPKAWPYERMIELRKEIKAALGEGGEDDRR